ncbi:extracellular solute-binding protein [Paenibacillus methanolicus]|uniref:Putative aldouronate transport system substrate-binding protein n=1 Tax=Paenibacillus methanolicus TaxID=582686 RepID=A0A5S5CCW6_9BACL|nr:extracellular solute-binding protein [Paenibacillus methanolicus]TYP76488.1 putative aldouronate transport system substrate-binding protein [Paenibacillus methanolicus]
MKQPRGRKWVAYAASLAALGFLLAGCSQNGGTSDNTSDEATRNNQTKTNQQTEVEAPKEKGKISVTVYDRGNVPSTEGTTEENRWTKYLNEKGPSDVRFVAVPRWESKQKLNVLFASASAPDLIFEYDPYIKNPLYDQKQLMPINDMIDQYSSAYKQMLADYPVLGKVGTKSDGKLYEFARLSEVVPIHAVLIREDWLKKLNLSVPQTTEELYEVAKAFAEQDPDGNSQKDTYGMAISFQSGQVVDQIFQATRWVEKDGKLTRNWDNFKAVAAFKKRLFDEGIVDKDFLNDKNGAKAKQDFINGKLGIYPLQLNWYNFTTGELASLKKNVPDAVVTPIPYPQSPAGRFNPAFTNPVQATAVVNAHAKNPEAIMQYVDFLVSQDTVKALKYGIEGEHWKKGANGCPEPIDPDKSKNEVGYTADLQMLSSGILDPQCGKMEQQFNPSVPVQAEGLAMFKKALEIYLDPSKPYVDITHPEHLPQIPKDIDTISTNIGKPIEDIWVKAVLGGSGYTPEMAMKEAMDTWEKGEGKKVEQWFATWWETGREDAFLADDIYAMLKQQRGIN